MKLISAYIETEDFKKSINFYKKVLQIKLLYIIKSLMNKKSRTIATLRKITIKHILMILIQKNQIKKIILSHLIFILKI